MRNHRLIFCTDLIFCHNLVYISLCVDCPVQIGESRGFDTYLRRVVSLSKDTFTPRKVLVIPRKRWLRPYMNEKLLTGTLSFNKTKPNQISEITVFSSGFFRQVYRVTYEDSISNTAVLSIFFLFKSSLLLKELSFNFHLLLLQLVLCCVAALKSLPVHHRQCRLNVPFGPLRLVRVF